MMHLEILTPDKQLFEGEVSLVRLPGILGSFEILTDHAPMLSALGEGKIKVRDTEGRNLMIDVKGGFVEVAENVVKVLIDG